MRLEPVLPWWVLAVFAVALSVVLALGLRLIPGEEGRRAALWRWGAMTGAAVLLLLAGIGPTVGGGGDHVPTAAGDREPNVFVLLDRSPDMSERQADGRTRMATARDDIAALIDANPDARFALIGFADRPSVQWPLSADTWSLRPVVAATEAYGDTPDANVGAAANVLRYQLISAVQQFPRARNLVFYLGAGAAGSDAPQREFDLPEGAVDGGAVLDYSGAPALRAVAGQIGVPLVVRTGGGRLDDRFADGGSGEEAVASRPEAAGVELYWVFAGLAALLLLSELYRVLRELRDNQPVELGATP